MSGRRKNSKLIEDIDRYFGLIDQAVLVFKDGVRNYLYSNSVDFNDNLQKMSSIESETEVLRREIENALYTQTALVRSCGDIMRLLEKTRNMTDILNDSLFQFEIETPFIPSQLNPEFMKLTEFSTLAVEAVALTMLFFSFDATASLIGLATLLRLGFSSKYIATLMNITPKSVEISRYRLRQKLGLSKGDSLVNFIRSI